jgi:branched-chain amino acid transport system ATP-binding protein
VIDGAGPGTAGGGAGLMEDEASVASLECFGVSVRFGGLTAVRDVDLRVPPATIVGLVGPNGAGKSTLFGVMSGLLRPSSGRVKMHGRDITDESPQTRASLGLARTFQHPEIFAGLTVREHLVLAHRVRYEKRRIWSDLFTMGSLRGSASDETQSVGDLLELLGLQAVADRPALGLPLGQTRLVEIGRALATSPSVLLLDEPSSGMDTGETEQFAETLSRVSAERQISVLLVEHDVELVMRLCSTIHVLDFGTLIASGSPAEVRSNAAVRAAYLGEEISPSTAQPANVGPVHTLDLLPAPAPESRADIAVEDLEVRYGDALALSGVTFALGNGKALAVLGANGAGKSSLARALSGLVPASRGRVFFQEQRIDGWSADRIRRAGIVHLPEVRGVFRSLSVLDNLKMAAASVPGRRARRDAVESALEFFPALAGRRRQIAASLSGGEQQMLSLARALSTSPRLIIADEMSLGLAPLLVDLVFEGLAKAKKAGVTVIMIEQYVHRALAFADECLLLQRGTVVWTGPAEAAGGELLANYLGAAVTATP